MIVHTYKLPLPGKPALEFRELTVTDLGHIARESVRDDGLNVMASTIKERSLRRLQAIRAYGKVRADSNGTAPSDVLTSMSAKAMSLYDEALRRVHEASEEETEAFFATHSATEV